MPVVTTRAVAATVSILRTRVRDSVADPAATTTIQRWTNSQIDTAIDDMLKMMFNELSGDDVSGFKESRDLVYPGNAQFMALPPEIQGVSVYQLQDIDDAANPFYIDWMDAIDFDRFSTRRGWNLAGNQLAVRPLPTQNKALRLWYIPPFVPISGTPNPSTDQHAMIVNHEELIVLGAAVRLQMTDDEVPQLRWVHYQQLWEQFKTSAAKFRGPVHVRTTRSYR